MRATVFVSSRALDHATRCADRVTVTSLVDLARALAARPSATPTSLDLVGHATRGHRYLRLGSDALDLLDPAVARTVRRLVVDGALDRARVAQIRVLGCATAVGDAARTSLVRLAWLTGRPVAGTTTALLDIHHGPDGFRPAFAHLLQVFRPARDAAQPGLGRHA